MSKRENRFSLCRVISLFLVLALIISFCPISAYARQTPVAIPFCIDDNTYYIDLQSINNMLYCRADQWAQAAGCLWKINSDQKRLIFYNNTPVILHSYSNQEYVVDGGGSWVPFFEIANETGVYFSSVKEGVVHGHRAKPLAVFYNDMDRMFGTSKYRITEMLLDLDTAWVVASSAARAYSILSAMSISGFIDAASGKMEQEVYDAVFIKLLQTDESLLWAFTDLGEEVTRLGKVINKLQKSLDEGSAFLELLEKMGFSESEINEIVWELSYEAYGNKTLNDLSDLYEIDKLTNLWELLGLIDDMTASIEADVHTVLAMQAVFADSDSTRIKYAAKKAIGARTGSKALTVGTYSLEYLEELLTDEALGKLEEAYEKSKDITSLEKLKAKALVWVYDKALSLTNKSDAIMYSEAYSQIQLDLAKYYYKHRDDGTEENGVMMHSVALLYLRACLEAYNLYNFDSSIAQPINNAKATLKAEISNLMEYTEEELLQNGTSKECVQSIVDLAHLYSEKTNSHNIAPTPTPKPIPSTVDNSRYYNDAVAAYEEMLRDGVLLLRENGDYIKATHYQRLDMNEDGIPEIIVYAVEDYVPSFEIYTYSNGAIKKIADSLNTCDISCWYNASHDIYIYAGKEIFAYADKATAAYTSESSSLLSYDGKSVKRVSVECPTQSVKKLVDNSEIVGGISIPQNSTPIPTTNNTYIATTLPDGEYFGTLNDWDKKSMTVELLRYSGRDVNSYNYILDSTGNIFTADISNAAIWLQGAWSDDGQDVKCKSIDSALNTEIWGGGTTVREQCTMQIAFVVENGIVKEVVILYAA